MSFYLKDGSLLWPVEDGAYDVRNGLPVGTYTVGVHPQKGYYLKPIEDFKIVGKIYGNTTRHAERILNTFDDRPNATGVLLNGEKGSGKTMLAKLVSMRAAELGMPTIVLNAPHCGDSFNSLIQSINEPCVVVFDEFEKVYDNEQQEAILTLLDGVFPSKKLFMLTVNDKYKVNAHMRNRPGRIFYMLDFKGLDQKFIREYCEDNLNDKSHIDAILRVALMFEAFNFDMLKALVEDMNRYNETPNQVLEMLNAKPFVDRSETEHHLKVILNGKEVPKGILYHDYVLGAPIQHDELEFSFNMPTGRKDADDDEIHEYIELKVTPRDLKKIDPVNGTFTYVLREGTPEQAVLVFTRETYQSSYQWQDAI